jgi:cytochrome P450
MLALDQHPDQLRWLMSDFNGRIDVAINEFVRWATPVIAHSRTASRDVEFHGAQIAKGDKVAIFYSSANRDEDRFTDPMKFDLSRDPNPHVSFGGGGVHFCLGSRLAIAILRAFFAELLGRTRVSVTGAPDYLWSTSINGIKRLPVNIS